MKGRVDRNKSDIASENGKKAYLDVLSSAISESKEKSENNKNGAKRFFSIDSGLEVDFDLEPREPIECTNDMHDNLHEYEKLMLDCEKVKNENKVLIEENITIMKAQLEILELYMNLSSINLELSISHDVLMNSASEIIERWNTPNWKDAPHTGVFIENLNKALKKAAEVKKWIESRNTEMRILLR